MGERSGTFIVFEGIEGSGKSTQTRLLYRRLRSLGSKAILTREPGGTPLGGRIRLMLKKSPQGSIEPLAELLLFMASRSQIVERVIRPGLEGGAVAVCDRYADSSLAYQGFGRGLPLETIGRLNEVATGGVWPDIVVLLDVPAGEGLKRKGRKSYDRFESEEIAFHQRVRDGYLCLARQAGHRWLVVDGTLSKAEIAETIWERIRLLVER